MATTTDDDEGKFCSKCGGSTPHSVTLYGLICDLCGKPRPVHGQGKDET